MSVVNEMTMMEQLQGAVGGEDYERGSPHLVHRSLREPLLAAIRAVVLDTLDRSGSCRVLEVGAGHGMFTDHVLAAGADVVVTEMSPRAFALLDARFRHNPRAQIVYEHDGEEVFRSSNTFNVVLCVSVLHHIPDYMAFLTRVVDRIEPGGSLLSFQDPLYYPRRSSASLRVDRAAFLAWRIGQGSLRRGLATQIRRWRGVYDETMAGDMVEYHVVRQGLDEEAIAAALSSRFSYFCMNRYWSTQSRLLQSVGNRVGSPNTFGITARGCLAA